MIRITAECCPVVDDKACSNNIGTSINRACAERDLQEIREFIEFFNGSKRMDKSTSIIDDAVRANEDIIRDCRAEDFNSKSICDDFLTFLVEIRVDECNVVIRNHTVAKCGQSLFDSSHSHVIRKRVTNLS